MLGLDRVHDVQHLFCGCSELSRRLVPLPVLSRRMAHVPREAPHDGLLELPLDLPYVSPQWTFVLEV